MASNNLSKYLEMSINKYWNVLALSDYKETPITYGQLADKIYRLHSTFEALNIKKGEKIALIGKNSVNWAVVYLAVTTYGAVIVPLLPDFLPESIVDLTNHSDAEYLFVANDIYSKLNVDKFTNLKAIFNLHDFSVLNGFEDIYNVLEIAPQILKEKYIPKLVPDRFVLPKVKNTDLMVISYTSGTSDLPKGVMLSHGSIGANLAYAKKYMPLTPGAPILSFLPLAHAYGCVFEFLFPIVMGCFITFLGKIPSPKIVLQAFSEIKPKLIVSVPLIIEKIYKKQIRPAVSDPKIKAALKIPILNIPIKNKIRHKVQEAFGGNFVEIAIGGAPLNSEVEDFFHFIGLNFTTGYGMTECGPLISYSSWKNRKVGGAGKKVDALKVRIDSPNKRSEEGEIQVKGEHVMMGYYKNEALTRQTFTADGWLKTGDLGTLGRDGTIFIRGRSKSMILGPSGQNIYPEEIESLLNNLPLISESLVIEKDNRLIALVTEDKDVSELQKIPIDVIRNEIFAYRDLVNTKLPNFMHLAEIEIMEKDFEKTPKNSIKRFLYTRPNN